MSSVSASDAAPTLYSMAFFDAQNLYRHAREAFEQFSEKDCYHHPSFDPLKLHQKVADHFGWKPNLTRFYSGIPLQSDNEMWGGYWANRKLALSRARVQVTTRPLRYHTEEFEDGSIIKVPHEKGIDIRIALDLVACARRKEFDVAIIFSQDQDLAEAVVELKDIARVQGRTIKIVSAFPENKFASRGIDKTDWFPMAMSFYEACLDERDYRPPQFRPAQSS